MNEHKEGERMRFPAPGIDTRSREYWVIPSQQRFGAADSVLVFSGAIKVPDLSKGADIKLVSDFQRKNSWELHRIIQRNITSSRVDDIKEKYLNNKQKAIKFFPAVTIAILPFENGKPGDSYNSGAGFLGHAGIFLSSPSGQPFTNIFPEGSEYWNYPAKLSWDMSEAVAVVIDGQHRIEAIRRFLQDDSRDDLAFESLPASFVLFQQQSLPIEATRQVFIDVNNTPRRVSEQKLIFIDDNNLPRRLTATLLGSPLNDGIVDPYIEIQKKGFLERCDFSTYFNRYLIGVEESDDASLNLGFTKSHDDLLPWQITHILTLHEVILQRTLLSEGSNYKFAGNGANIKRICRIINRPFMENILAEKGGGDTEDRMQKAKRGLERVNLDGSEIRFLNQFWEWRMKNLEDIAEVYEENEAGSEGGAAETIQELSDRFNSFCTSTAALERTAEDIRLLILGRIGRVNKLVLATFSQLWFVSDLVEMLSSSEPISPELKLQIIHEAHDLDIKQKRRLSVYGDVRSFVTRIGEELSLNADEMEGAKRWVSSLREVTGDNLLCSQVGQQALFIWLRRIDDSAGGDLTHILEPERDQFLFLNSLGRRSLFQNKKYFCVKIEGFKLEGNILEGTVVERSVMRPGWENAKKAATALQILSKKIGSREDADNDAIIGRNEYKTTLGSIGASLLRQFELLDGDITRRSDALIKSDIQTSAELFLSESDFQYLKDASKDTLLEDTRLKRMVSQVLGGLYLRKIQEDIKNVER